MKGKNSMVRRTYSEKESAGLDTGLSMRSDFESSQTMSDSDFNQSGSMASGFTRQAKGKRKSSSVSEKGVSLTIEG